MVALLLSRCPLPLAPLDFGVLSASAPQCHLSSGQDAGTNIYKEQSFEKLQTKLLTRGIHKIPSSSNFKQTWSEFLYS